MGPEIVGGTILNNLPSIRYVVVDSGKVFIGKHSGQNEITRSVAVGVAEIRLFPDNETHNSLDLGYVIGLAEHTYVKKDGEMHDVGARVIVGTGLASTFDDTFQNAIAVEQNRITHYHPFQ
jgi:hypothetical protein